MISQPTKQLAALLALVKIKIEDFSYDPKKTRNLFGVTEVVDNDDITIDTNNFYDGLSSLGFKL